MSIYCSVTVAVSVREASTAEAGRTLFVLLVAV